MHKKHGNPIFLPCFRGGGEAGGVKFLILNSHLSSIKE